MHPSERYEILQDIPGTSSARVLRGRRISDGTPVVVKTTRSEHPSQTQLAQLQHEYALLSQVEEAPVARALELIRFGNSLALVLQDAGQTSLADIIADHPDGLELGRALRLARSAAAGLAAIHALDIIHKDLKPHHLFPNDDGTSVTIIDFGMATQITQELQPARDLDELEGTLPYIAPERLPR